MWDTRCKHCNCKKRKIANITYKRNPEKEEILNRKISVFP